VASPEGERQRQGVSDVGRSAQTGLDLVLILNLDLVAIEEIGGRRQLADQLRVIRKRPAALLLSTWRSSMHFTPKNSRRTPPARGKGRHTGLFALESRLRAGAK
jgi:hypothetical protein